VAVSLRRPIAKPLKHDKHPHHRSVGIITSGVYLIINKQVLKLFTTLSKTSAEALGLGACYVD